MNKKFDPRTIFASTIFIVVALVLMNSFLSALFCGAAVVLQLYTFGFEKKNMIQLMKYSLGLFISIIFVNYFFMDKSVTEITISLLRLIGIIMLAVSLLTSMDVIDIGYAIEKILHPLKLVKIPVETIGTVTAISLKFIPILQEEASRILTAQKARGIDYDLMTVRERIKNIPTLFLPVIISGIHHSISLAAAMEVRGYGAPVQKTRLYEQKLSKKDWLYLSGSFLFLLILIILVYNT